MADHAHNLRAQRAHGRPFGVITRGTTNQNRLRRCDRWMVNHPEISSLLRHHPQPLALDVGYGASHTTTVEWAGWLRRVNPRVQVTGLEIAPERVLPPRDGVSFELGGFELAGYRPQLVRAFNVLRQYDVAQVPAAWEAVTSRLAPGGFFVEGTCDELGRRCAWLLLDAAGPRSLTFAWEPADAARPSDLAERLPKILIHRNVPGEPIHELLQAADRAWERNAGWAPHGPRVRWRMAHAQLRAEGWPLVPLRRRLSDNSLTIAWEAVAPQGFSRHDG
ncbi:class I SAM-dependent methyltransferase [Corynebacterium lizhenjunii]|uniref:Class I SAM-dependent methyltransferase n=1 Tax=Corynebacterium lizhenjunii TaxID=2709394 RepID=A0A7T0KEM1_9CORY|nr:class I SAM-dependent methyltransferase [Corynebacterium lizhenjunii]QPK79386.1 class I SAM-dependent methyltransferase [Corynebacterium lizhenjunii]